MNVGKTLLLDSPPTSPCGQLAEPGLVSVEAGRDVQCL